MKEPGKSPPSTPAPDITNYAADVFVATLFCYVFSSHRVIAGSPRNLGAPDWTS